MTRRTPNALTVPFNRIGVASSDSRHGGIHFQDIEGQEIISIGKNYQESRRKYNFERAHNWMSKQLLRSICVGIKEDHGEYNHRENYGVNQCTPIRNCWKHKTTVKKEKLNKTNFTTDALVFPTVRDSSCEFGSSVATTISVCDFIAWQTGGARKRDLVSSELKFFLNEELLSIRSRDVTAAVQTNQQKFEYSCLSFIFNLTASTAGCVTTLAKFEIRGDLAELSDLWMTMFIKVTLKYRSRSM
ncbi:hypothetical protein WN51_07418 [Melipona quadrifasciata]|uniref:Uncharacterized protein n=1 Tax=Melipona quadrifasciata TaxID=166423 RepID=A0A0M8ZPD3_9HYME|nr:hypothetical protein WN51_07418 [Melipona quadrifasciata]